MKPWSPGRWILLAVGISACGGHGLRSGKPDAGDAALGPGSEGIPGSGSAVGSGGTSDLGGSAPLRDGSAPADAGTTPTAKPRVSLIGPAADQLRACDADGNTVADYRFALDFGSGYGERTIWLGGNSIRWDAPGGPYPCGARRRTAP